MNIIKHEHACLVVEEQGRKLVIDPGVYTTSLTDLTNIVAVVVTHTHDDHYSAELLQAIVAQNPTVRLFGTAEIAKMQPTLSFTAVTNGAAETVAPFSLQFFGEQHALVFGDQPQTQNVGVLINNRLFYPGDALTTPSVPVEVLALPIGGPWLKLGEAMELLTAVKPRQFFGTHDAHLSEIGHGSVDGWLEGLARSLPANYKPLRPGESLSL